MSRLTLIVAATATNGIGQNAGLPWRLPKEMAYFARVTTNAPDGTQNAVIMGRNTWESIPKKYRPLPKRVNVVVSRNQSYQLYADAPPEHDALLRHDLLSALARLDSVAVHRRFVIGGATLYAESLALPPSAPAFVDRVLLTRILSPAFEACDAFMPNFLADAESRWERASHDELRAWVGFDAPSGVQEEKGVHYEFQMWVRGVARDL
ncbi:hypothetical protein BV25DRAFT_1809959 [Artomyces pyxidatus]|uniref:Uncharacterized protein n=1 Tax=Artomyces pyxidatus TaxID=48021 RepID=A0ACB8SQP2_9AGAM|nr:hypothetical protein BV25DRAFT_1809959 [Artomyces pyxidatus]